MSTKIIEKIIIDCLLILEINPNPRKNYFFRTSSIILIKKITDSKTKATVRNV